MMSMSGWGRVNPRSAHVYTPRHGNELAAWVQNAHPTIARGLGRSYGDSAVAEHVLAMQGLDWLQHWNPATGELACAAGMSLDAVLAFVVPQGWFLPVTPGSRFVTLGGAVASDVHGKNHHVHGTFGQHVRGLTLRLGNGERLSVSATEHPDLLAATCGGMGLTGVIEAVQLQLVPLKSSTMHVTYYQLPNLTALLASFTEHAQATYSVAWLDAWQGGAGLGRGVLMLGEHATQGPLQWRAPRAWTVPVDMPHGLLGGPVLRAFNAWTYARGKSRRMQQDLIPYFYPLDALAHWNRLYGRRGFYQYQFVVPNAAAATLLPKVLRAIQEARVPPLLAVLKAFGAQNHHLLSFPMPGYTLAVDFPATEAAATLMDTLDHWVHDAGGRVYLAKDTRLSQRHFRQGYPQWEAFEAVRAKYHAAGRFASYQSKRLGLA